MNAQTGKIWFENCFWFWVLAVAPVLREMSFNDVEITQDYQNWVEKGELTILHFKYFSTTFSTIQHKHYIPTPSEKISKNKFVLFLSMQFRKVWNQKKSENFFKNYENNFLVEIHLIATFFVYSFGVYA